MPDKSGETETPSVYFIENLSLRSWITSVWPRIRRDRKAGLRKPSSFYFFDGSRASIVLAKATAWTIGTQIRMMEFSLFEPTNESGDPIWLYADTQELALLQERVKNHDLVSRMLKDNLDRPRFSLFLSKCLAKSTPPEPGSPERALHLVGFCAWETQKNHPQNSDTVLFLDNTPWLDAVIPHSAKKNVELIPTNRSQSLKYHIRNILPAKVATLLRLLFYRQFLDFFRQLGREMSFRIENDQSPAQSSHISSTGSADAKSLIAVEYFGQLNLNNAEQQSNLAFWQQSSFPGNDLLVLFTSPMCPLDERCQAELNDHQISALSTHPGATKLAVTPRFHVPPNHGKRNRGTRLYESLSPEAKWLEEKNADYLSQRHYWDSLFTAYNVRIFVGYNKLEAGYCAAADALENLGGITVNYSRSYETFASPHGAGSADVMFSFSQKSVDREICSGSISKYHVITGFLGDHRFPLLKESAQAIREAIQSNGAKHILAYFDENSADDRRWRISHQDTRENYRFLLEKLLSEPWLGLVIKPKVPNSLHSRLGPVSELLKRAEDTGRCHVFNAGGLQGSYPPSAAALASDVAIHGHLFAGTAGLESALTGVPTLLLDREGTPTIPLYNLGVGQVVFKDWTSLWKSCVEHWDTLGANPDLGDWSSSIDSYDPFRDGRASERMGTYIQWLFEGLRSGKDRASVMADAARRYRNHWGDDKVTQVDTGPQSR